MDACTIDNLENADPYAETPTLIARMRHIAWPGIYRHSVGRWKEYHEPKFHRHEKIIIEEQLQLALQNFEGGQRHQPQDFQPQRRQKKRRTADPFWGVDRPQRQQLTQEDQPSTRNEQGHREHISIEEGETGSDTDQDPSILEGPGDILAKYVGVKSVRYKKIDHAQGGRRGAYQLGPG